MLHLKKFVINMKIKIKDKKLFMSDNVYYLGNIMLLLSLLWKRKRERKQRHSSLSFLNYAQRLIGTRNLLYLIISLLIIVVD